MEEQKNCVVSTEITQLIRPNILNMPSMASPREHLNEEKGPGVMLDLHEMSESACPTQYEELNRYPRHLEGELKNMIAEYKGDLSNKEIFLGVGSLDVLDIIIRTFCVPGTDNMIWCPPSFPLFKMKAMVNDVKLLSVPLDHTFNLEVDKILDSVTENTKLIYLSSPNTPTGNNLIAEDIVKILTSSQYKGVTLIDEAYIDLSSSSGFLPMLKDYKRLIILQTMSKSFGLAGIRLGMGFAHFEVIEQLNKVKSPCCINILAQKVAIEALKNLNSKNELVNRTMRERGWLTEKLMSFQEIEKVYPSEANFILFKVKNAPEIYRSLIKIGVYISYEGYHQHCENCLCVTVGNHENNELFLLSLAKILENK